MVSRMDPPHAPVRERVLRAALDLVDREGVDGLTMRRLGRELGVEAMSLYGYVDSKEDLIEGVVEQVFRQMPLIVPGPGHWQDRLRHHAAAYRQVLLDHPNAVRLVAGRPLDDRGHGAFVDSALAELRALGLDLETADRVLGVIASFTLGHVAEQVGDGPGPARGVRRATTRRRGPLPARGLGRRDEAHRLRPRVRARARLHRVRGGAAAARPGRRRRRGSLVHRGPGLDKVIG